MDILSKGKHCSMGVCNKLDFLPMTCEGCHDTFCDEHWKFGSHNCPKEQDIIQSRIVPTCPVCGVVVPVKRGEDPNLRMEQHIARNCADPGKAATNPVFTNQCNVEGCKKKEVIPFKCNECDRNHCIRHRLPPDHDCAGKPTVISNFRQMFGDSASRNRVRLSTPSKLVVSRA
eukprot:Partr_v1_DN27589_c0_g1_i11_m30304 putative zinc finger